MSDERKGNIFDRLGPSTDEELENNTLSPSSSSQGRHYSGYTSREGTQSPQFKDRRQSSPELYIPGEGDVGFNFDDKRKWSNRRQRSGSNSRRRESEKEERQKGRDRDSSGDRDRDRDRDREGREKKTLRERTRDSWKRRHYRGKAEDEESETDLDRQKGREKGSETKASWSRDSREMREKDSKEENGREKVKTEKGEAAVCSITWEDVDSFEVKEECGKVSQESATEKKEDKRAGDEMADIQDEVGKPKIELKIKEEPSPLPQQPPQEQQEEQQQSQQQEQKKKKKKERRSKHRVRKRESGGDGEDKNGGNGDKSKSMETEVVTVVPTSPRDYGNRDVTPPLEVLQSMQSTTCSYPQPFFPGHQFVNANPATLAFLQHLSQSLQPPAPAATTAATAPVANNCGTPATISVGEQAGPSILSASSTTATPSGSWSIPHGVTAEQWQYWLETLEKQRASVNGSASSNTTTRTTTETAPISETPQDPPTAVAATGKDSSEEELGSVVPPLEPNLCLPAAGLQQTVAGPNPPVKRRLLDDKCRADYKEMMKV